MVENTPFWFWWRFLLKKTFGKQQRWQGRAWERGCNVGWEEPGNEVATLAGKSLGTRLQRWLGNVLIECKNFENSGISNLWTTSRDCPEFLKQHSRN